MPTGDWILLGIFIFIIASWIYLPVSQSLEEKWTKETFKAALAFEIADGVTLLQGIRAYFKEDGAWVPGCKSVIILAGARPGLVVHLNCEPKKGRLEVVRCYQGDVEVKPCDPDELIGLMVQAVRKQRSEAPW